MDLRTFAEYKCHTFRKEKGRELKTLQKMIRHPAGRIGLMVGLTLGFIAAIMGEGSKALLFAGLCRFLAKRFGR